MSASLTRTQPAMLKSLKFLHRDNLERALPDSSRHPVTRNSSRRGQPRATAIIPASCTCAQPNISSLTRSLQYLPKASRARSPNSPTLGQPETSTLVNPRHPEARTARPSSVTPWQSSTTNCFRWGSDAAMAFKASSSRDAHLESSRVVTRGHPKANALKPTLVNPGMPGPINVSSSGQCFARVNREASVSSSHSETLRETILGCMTQISWIVEFVTGRKASFR
mmetsp:Transcript_14720/g.38996  ORF Transcript_14720/g.38996 Transcript_14720/m.38996 type:complete len:224 (+) Transcript_14720:2207-2878(+)